MTSLLLKSGILLMAAAGIFITAAFIALALFSLLAITPGLLLYRAGIKSAYAEIVTPQSGAKMIDVTPTNTATDISAKSKALLKSGARKLRNYLNKFAD